MPTSRNSRRSYASRGVDRTEDPRLLSALFIAFLILSINLGASEYVSFQCATWGFLLLVVLRPATWRRSEIYGIVGAAFFALAHILVFVLRKDTSLGHWALSMARDAIGVFMLFWVKNNTSPSLRSLSIAALTVAVVIAMVWAGLQLLSSKFLGQQILTIPQSAYALKYGTLASGLAESGMELTKIRPSGPFSEPSALAVLGTCGLLVGLLKHKRKLTLCSIVLIAIAQSVNGFVAAIVCVAYVGIRSRRKALFILLIAMAVALGVAVESKRLDAIQKGSDDSANVRIIYPFSMIRKAMPAGISYDEGKVQAQQSFGTSSVFDNWNMKELVTMGAAAFPVFILLFLMFREGEGYWVLLFLVANFNGALFYYDRIVLLFFAFAALSNPKRVASIKRHALSRRMHPQQIPAEGLNR